ncbi:ABC transporter substrate-binding protein [Roseinatronobacter monicus]|uniref:Amino acid/amide ABC transporter substrate-binding protein (HAAT family) n=1 Tax=Roseinatronobacter monicus TaxID=393481 RepID=A0A543KH53_9RHOB|nr:ABC transporter substrate-binding protein [Roseinatronobacter monicus]TQM94411.1 amino acid/amide ABC transporter substrate-binding protein (HAAT family) [Roseinatronobacter monicus]
MSVSRRHFTAWALGTTAAVFALSGAMAQDTSPIRIGSITTLEGPFATGGQDAYRAMEMAFEAIDYTVGGRQIEWIRESSNATPDVALARARKLIEQDEVDIIIGPLSGAEGIALRDYSRTLDGKTIINGSSGAADTTLRDPSPNFFRFNTEGTQWMAGLGTHAYEDMGSRHVALVAADYAFPYAQVFGFMHEYCELGGAVTKLWSPLNTTDFSSIIAQFPDDIDAVLLIQGGTDALAFLTQYAEVGGDLPIIGGSITADQTLLSARGPHQSLMEGMVAAGPIADLNDDPNWEEFVANYRERWPDGFDSPSIHAVNYYTNTNTIGVLQALEEVGGDLSDNQEAFQAALASIEFTAPTGANVRLDDNRQAISDIFLTRIVNDDGTMRTEAFGRTEDVSQTLGMETEEFWALGSPSRDNPSCPPAN